LQFGLTMPASRQQEQEADDIGLLMMAKSCYDPAAAVKVWERMQNANKDAIPQWMSTHPSNASRITRMQAGLPKAEEARNDSGCAVTLGYSEAFSQALGMNSSRGPKNHVFRDHPAGPDSESGNTGGFWGSVD